MYKEVQLQRTVHLILSYIGMSKCHRHDAVLSNDNIVIIKCYLCRTDRARSNAFWQRYEQQTQDTDKENYVRLGKAISLARLGLVENANLLNSGREEPTTAIRTLMAAVEQPLEGKLLLKSYNRA